MEWKCNCITPQWTFREDDVYCPRCGGAVTWLKSPYQINTAGPAEEIWIYFNREGSSTRITVLEFPIYLESSTDSGTSGRKEPKCYSCRLEGQDCNVKVREENSEYYCRIQPGIPLAVTDKGIKLRAELEGNFKRQELLLSVWKVPKIEVNLESKEGAGISRVRSDADEQTWEVYPPLPTTLEFKLMVHGAPIIVRTGVRALEGDKEDVRIEINPPLPNEYRLSPEKPFSSTASVALDGLEKPGEESELRLDLDCIGLPIEETQVRLVFRRVSRGVISFHPERFEMELFEDEVASNSALLSPWGRQYPILRPLYVYNRSAESVELQRPVVDPPTQWLRVDWAREDWSREGQLNMVSGIAIPNRKGIVELKPGQRAGIFVEVDLRKLSEGKGAGSSLEAKVSVSDSAGNKAYLPLCCPKVLERKTFDYHIAIDFGNSHSYVITRKPSPRFPRDGEEWVPVHDLEIPEQFPTALFFDDLSDVDHPVYCIGREASERARYQPAFLVRDLKRWLGSSRHDRRQVMDRAGKTHVFSIEELVRLYLKKLLVRVQDVIREKWVTRLAVTCPTRFQPEQRRALERVMHSLGESWNEGRTKLEVRPIDVDEATVGAIDLVFEQQFQECLAQSILSTGKSGEREFVIASLDLGGGSLDTALLKFKCRDSELLPLDPTNFAIEYLGVGGDETLGGDCVTLVVLNVLREKMQTFFSSSNSKQVLDRLSKLGPYGETDPTLYQLHHLLWSSAEKIKIAMLSNGDLESVSSSTHESLLRAELEDMWEAANQSRSEGLRQIPPDGQEVYKDVLRFVKEGPLDIDPHDAFSRQFIDFWGRNSRSLRDRVVAAIDELIGFASDHNAKIDFVVLAGASCRARIIREIVEERLRETWSDSDFANRIWYDQKNLKARVARGLARFVEVYDSWQGFISPFGRCRAELVVRIPGSGRYETVVKNADPIDNPEVGYIIQSQSKPIPIVRLGNPIVLYETKLGSRVERWKLELPKKYDREATGEIHFMNRDESVQLWVRSGTEIDKYDMELITDAE